MEEDLLSDETSGTVVEYDLHRSAMEALFAQIRDVMRGKGDSTEEVNEICKLLLIETAQGYARAVQSIPDYNASVEFAGYAMHLALTECQSLVAEYDTEISISIIDAEDIIELISQTIDIDDDRTEQFESLEEILGGQLSRTVAQLMQYADENIKDAQRDKRERLKAQAIEILKDSTKIALGAAAAVLITGIRRKEF